MMSMDETVQALKHSALSGTPRGGHASALHAYLHKRVSETLAIDVAFELRPGVTVLFGPSGSGKSTIIAMLAGLLRPEKALIHVDGRVLDDTSKRIHAGPQQRRVGYVAQTLALFPHLTVEQNVAFGIESLPRDERESRVRELLAAFGIERFATRKANSLSGGERQRVALARALAPHPDYLLLDEPMSALDLTSKRAILDALFAYVQRRPLPVLYVTHDRAEVYSLAQQVIVIEQGKLVAQGDPFATLGHAPTLATMNTGGFENVLRAKVMSVNNESGSLTCALEGGVTLECPLGHVEPGEEVQLGIRAGDVLLANVRPVGISARNIVEGVVAEVTPTGEWWNVAVDLGSQNSLRIDAHVTRAAVRSLAIEQGSTVWVIVKTHSIALLR